MLSPALRFTSELLSEVGFGSCRKMENHILQFQPDRFIANWKRQLNPQQYPRLEGVAAAFADDLHQLEEQFASRFACKININQAETGYISIIPVESFSEASDWFRMWSSNRLNTESLDANFSEMIKDEADRPFARLRHDLQSVLRRMESQRHTDYL